MRDERPIRARDAVPWSLAVAGVAVGFGAAGGFIIGIATLVVLALWWLVVDHDVLRAVFAAALAPVYWLGASVAFWLGEKAMDRALVLRPNRRTE